MQWDTVECGRVRFFPGTGLVAVAGQGEVEFVYRAHRDGKWHAYGRFDDVTGRMGWHNVGAPALYAYCNGERNRLSLWWGQLGKPHRVDGPAHAEFHDTSRGNWYLAGSLHRIEGPATASDGWHLDNVAVAACAWHRRARRLRWLRCQ